MYQLSPEPNRFYRSLDFGSCQIRVHRINERYFPYPRHARNPGSSLRFLERHCYRRMVQPGSGMRHKHLAQSPLRRHRLEPRQPRHSYRLSRSSAPAPATISNPFSFIWGRFLSLLETPKNEGTRLIRSEIGLPKGDNEVFPVRLHTGES
jgi:hypothetical protein